MAELFNSPRAPLWDCGIITAGKWPWLSLRHVSLFSLTSSCRQKAEPQIQGMMSGSFPPPHRPPLGLSRQPEHWLQ